MDRDSSKWPCLSLCRKIRVRQPENERFVFLKATRVDLIDPRKPALLSPLRKDPGVVLVFDEHLPRNLSRISRSSHSREIGVCQPGNCCVPIRRPTALVLFTHHSRADV